jgi:hypothetical protein
MLCFIVFFFEFSSFLQTSHKTTGSGKRVSNSTASKGHIGFKNDDSN